MNLAIDKFQKTLAEVRRIKSFNPDELQNIKEKIRMLLTNYFPDDEAYKSALENIGYAGDDNVATEVVEIQKSLIKLLKLIIEDLEIKEAESLKASEDIAAVEKYRRQMQKMKNDYEKDLLLEKNNYAYLKKKYELLQYNYEKLRRDYEDAVGKKRRWVIFFLLAAPVVALIFLSDYIFPISYAIPSSLEPVFKTAVSLGIVSALLYYPLRSRQLIIFGALAFALGAAIFFAA